MALSLRSLRLESVLCSGNASAAEAEVERGSTAMPLNDESA
eukprot:CAMPEP_0202850706 /NCGR_PEP_ID=MMETSP1389-20130828/84393_1 /ASSEMBLY_ACC=CAM_ASM_000865 /TAXON_ID=302021 /ORGANISM="Rhodomonas sp., Strain CCMP768" /LENGTH=40 /DNA_ID= /DNA_START= /DNA_END= /DNA_ORIENTATION=